MSEEQTQKKPKCAVSATKSAVKEAVAETEAESIKKTALPVTVLAGFLGAGKTTLLRHLLSNSDGVRIACVVNDVASLNIDSALVKGSVKQQAEELIELQNGCVCCTLRADLVRAVAELARDGAFDQVVIECTGMAEPLQVAGSFLMALAVKDANDANANANDGGAAASNDLVADMPSLKGVARLDTCVTVVDCASFFDVLERTTGLAEAQPDDNGDNGDARSGAAPHGERPLIVDLMMEQVEFADVVVLNKTDLVTAATLARVQQAIAAVNPGAALVTSVHSRVDASLILNTGRFDAEKTASGAGWLRALRSTNDFGVDSFVYRRRRPFHPARFHALLAENFIVDCDWEKRAHAHDHGDDADGDAAHAHAGHVHTFKRKDEEELDEHASDDAEHAMRVGTLRKNTGLFGNVLRSKGYVWLATRPDIKGLWQQAGAVCRIDPEAPWNAVFPREMWPDDPQEVAAIERELAQNEHGDRRQEIVIIGLMSDAERKEIADALDLCLVTDREWRDLARLVVSDPLPLWQREPFDDFAKFDADLQKELAEMSE